MERRRLGVAEKMGDFAYCQRRVGNILSRGLFARGVQQHLIRNAFTRELALQSPRRHCEWTVACSDARRQSALDFRRQSFSWRQFSEQFFGVMLEHLAEHRVAPAQRQSPCIAQDTAAAPVGIRINRTSERARERDRVVDGILKVERSGSHVPAPSCRATRRLAGYANARAPTHVNRRRWHRTGRAVPPRLRIRPELRDRSALAADLP